MGVLELRDIGLYCPAGHFYIDPTRGVERAIITHAHSDHARPGSGCYLSHPLTAPILAHRLGRSYRLETLEYGEQLRVNDAVISLHPAGHIPGSSQVRIEIGGEVWVVSGDYKTTPDPVSTPFDPIRCHTFITECTFGLPIFRFMGNSIHEINQWWSNNVGERSSVLYAYSLGKAQRILSEVDISIGPIYVHSSVEDINEILREANVSIPRVQRLREGVSSEELKRALVLIPPGSSDTPLDPSSTAFASGWMSMRNRRLKGGFDVGFVVSDHADWPGLLSAIEATGAQRVLTTHGYTESLARYLREKGHDAAELTSLSGNMKR